MGMILLMDNIELLILFFMLLSNFIILVREGLFFFLNVEFLFFLLEFVILFLNVMVVIGCFCFISWGSV